MTFAERGRKPRYAFATMERLGINAPEVKSSSRARSPASRAGQEGAAGVLKVCGWSARSNNMQPCCKRFDKENCAFTDGAVGTPEGGAWKRAVISRWRPLDDVSKIYVERYFPPETKAAADELVKNVVAAMGRRIDGLTWMQPQTKVRARAKLANFVTKIGYPTQWHDYSTLEIVPGDAVGNAMRAAEWNHADQVSKLGGPIRRWEWGMTPMTINAYANFGMREIVFPAAILQPPFFDPNADPAVNYGGIGAVIGHESSHHYDDKGANMTRNGRSCRLVASEDVQGVRRAAGKALIANMTL